MTFEHARLGPYEIVATLGAGGMGEVYRVHDTKLGRDVALKILPESFVHDPDRVARFRREAQVLASLNHPHIAQIYGLEESSGASALVMELVEGSTLADRIALRPIPIDEALPIAKQIAEALEAAHEQGIIHRDLKPANIKVRDDGMVKVLDFGLAKALEPKSAISSPNVTASPTVTTPAMRTGVGVILGTAPYMSPEQAKGRAADKRSDIWAFGCVLYEMLTGGRAFEGDDARDTLAAVLRAEPDWTALPGDTPPAVRRLLRRTLAKDPRKRLADAADVRLELEEATSGEPHVASATPVSRSRVPLIIAAAVISAAVSGSAWVMLWKSEPARVIRLTATPFDGKVGDASGNPDVAITSDGRHVVYTNGAGPNANELFVRALDQLEPRALHVAGALGPFLSPDGNWIGFAHADGVLKKIAISGGPPVTICSVTLGGFRGASWSADDMIVFALTGGQGLMKVSASGGTPVPLATPNVQKHEVDYAFPEILPNGQAVLFTVVSQGGPNNPENLQIGALNLRTGEHKILIMGGSNARYVRSGHLVYATAGTLRAVPFDPERLEVRGTPVPIVEHVVTKSSGAGSFGVAGNGTLVYIEGIAAANAQRTLVWVDRAGHEEALGVPLRAYAYPRISPDGTRVALDIRDQENDMWIWDLRRQTLTRLTFDPGPNRGVSWTPDGRRLAFSAVRNGKEIIFWQAADGTGAPEPLTHGDRPQVPISFTADGKHLLFDEPGFRPYDLGLASIPDGQTQLLLHEPYSESNGMVSPDGRWLAYESDESRRPEVYVRPFPNIDCLSWI